MKPGFAGTAILGTLLSKCSSNEVDEASHLGRKSLIAFLLSTVAAIACGGTAGSTGAGGSQATGGRDSGGISSLGGPSATGGISAQGGSRPTSSGGSTVVGDSGGQPTSGGAAPTMGGRAATTGLLTGGHPNSTSSGGPGGNANTLGGANPGSGGVGPTSSAVTGAGGASAAGGSAAAGGVAPSSGGRGGTSFGGTVNGSGGRNTGGFVSQGGAVGGLASVGGSTPVGGSGPTAYNPCPTNGDPCKILPFGDSITDGVQSTDLGGYRSQLFKLVVAASQKVIFTGSQSSGPDSVSNTKFPKNHEGHSGWTIDPGYSSYGSGGISTLVPSPAFSTLPGIVLLMIGTNDVTYTSGQDGMPTRLQGLLDKIVTAAPNALIVLATITPLSWSAAARTTYNAQIPGIAQARAAKGQHIISVDMSTMPTSSLASDGVHPNDQGYVYMAGVWYAAIKGFLPK